MLSSKLQATFDPTLLMGCGRQWIVEGKESFHNDVRKYVLALQRSVPRLANLSTNICLHNRRHCLHSSCHTYAHLDLPPVALPVLRGLCTRQPRYPTGRTSVSIAGGLPLTGRTHSVSGPGTSQPADVSADDVKLP